MPKQTSVLLENDCALFLKENRAVTDQNQTDTVNAALRLYALLHDNGRLSTVVDKADIPAILELIQSPAASAPIPSRLRR